MKRAVAVLCAALLVALGFLMPRIAAAYQDQSLVGDVRQMENAAVSLALAEEMADLTELDLFQSLGLFSSHVTAVELNEGYYTSAAGALRIADELTERCVYYGFESSYPTEAVPFLLTDEDGRSGIFWRCGWEERPYEAIWVDDQHMNLVGFRLRLLLPLPFEDTCQMICRRFFPPYIDADSFRDDNGSHFIELSAENGSVVLPVFFTMEYPSGVTFLYFNIPYDQGASSEIILSDLAASGEIASGEADSVSP